MFDLGTNSKDASRNMDMLPKFNSHLTRSSNNENFEAIVDEAAAKQELQLVH